MKKIILWILILLLILGIAFAVYEYTLDSNSIIKKPAVYLYPENDMDVSIKLNINGKLTKSIPSYNSGWKVFVTKNGLIENRYDYLFYEADLNKLNLPEEGWIVDFYNLEEWFDINLAKLGLNEKEKNQFNEYWLNELPESNFYEIKLITKEFLDNNLGLIVVPEPETNIRLNFYFKPLKYQTRLVEPLIMTPERNGFTVVEWGGILDD